MQASFPLERRTAMKKPIKMHIAIRPPVGIALAI
jgi:hypothetical protein